MAGLLALPMGAAAASEPAATADTAAVATARTLKTTKASNFRYKDVAFIGRIRDSAAKRNLVLIAPHTPGDPGMHRLHNWWDDREKGAYARNLVDAAIIRHGLDYSQVWLTGWSGGAELITKELMAHRQSWFTGATIPKDWSAKVASQRGVATYRRAGFTNAKIVTVANQGHFYNVSAIIERGLAETYRPPADSGRPVRGTS
ncbi:hypothetical protein BSZ39_11770 [Bowdeniella nasicola]|uniref:Alpha/beta hydrolase n=1 Tax=Bowdeniella nasicola TaxID=208480 RepID=A0A1Q5PZF9_9ACTO|nr:hypothetical protein [Bowdeniella nasicola]OKL53004.1 hypothetical protein BSZ39_11770 [Bowdeniella nasicola]